MHTSIDLFCGAGGLSIGLERSGFAPLFAADIMSDACDTYAARFQGVELHRGDTRTVDFKRFSGIDLVAGGPPCQPFSSGGKREGRDDARDVLPEFVRAVLEAGPRAFLMENVAGLATTHVAYLNRVLAPLFGRYTITGPTVLNAADFGVPQSRKRMVIVGVEKGRRAVRLPTSTVRRHTRSGDILSPRARGTLNLSRITYAKTPDLRPSPYHGQLFNGGGRPIDLDGPAPTILASAGGNKTPFVDVGGHVPSYHGHLLAGGPPRQGDLDDARRITVEECAALQTFPEDMRFSGSRSSRYTQVGNAVPPLFAAAVASCVLEALRR